MCSRPADAPFRVISPDRQSWNVGEIISYQCVGETELVGEERARCLDSGVFMNPPPTCRNVPQSKSALKNISNTLRTNHMCIFFVI